uniref:H-type lectin domain-containing protein n=1 Tax=Candidatus Kentrum sp. UNK TaxID=2126344 RepID=A0A451ALB7_9GAMM|nr:MAG: H-type lectin domain-containing protein [Candidatus Kentron sp. UNK]VFK72228.1 MAG: H-type lectin domain-containing protein [Candidatus Kentron sp. UNK]
MKTQKKKSSRNYSRGAAVLAGSCLLSGTAWSAPLVNTEGLVIGDNNQIGANANSAAFGAYSQALGPSSVAFSGSHAGGSYGAAFGTSGSTGSWSTSFGRGIATGNNSAAFGQLATASGAASIAFGWCGTHEDPEEHDEDLVFYSDARGDYSAVFGLESMTESYASMVIGRDNGISGSIGSWEDADLLFVLGGSNGQNNALMVLKNGKVGIETSAPEVELDVYGSVAFGGDANDTVQLGSAGTPFAAMRVGKYDVGTSSSNIKTVTVSFGQTFGAAPVVVATAATQPGKTRNDVFAVTARSITTTGFVAIIKRMDETGGWGQKLDLNWEAYEL